MTNPTQALAKPAQSQKPSALAVMASKFSVDPNKLLDTLKATVFKNATNEELLALVVVANAYDLNPLLKEMYAFPAKGGGIVPVISVDGWNKLMLRQPDFDGIEFEFEHIDSEGGRILVACTATVHVKSRLHPVRITEYLEECKRNTEPWNNMPHRMLRNRTLCQAARVAFGFSGIHDEDEAQAIIVEAAPMPAKQLAAVAAPAETNGEAIKSEQEKLADLVTGAGHSFDDLARWGMDTGNLPAADSWTGFDEIPLKDARRLNRATDGLLKGLAGGKVVEA